MKIPPRTACTRNDTIFRRPRQAADGRHGRREGTEVRQKWAYPHYTRKQPYPSFILYRAPLATPNPWSSQHPQPSDDPNDPLNWPLWRRDLITFTLSVTAIFATALGPILAANTLTLSLYFTLDFTRIAILTGYFLLGVGFAGMFFVPSSRIWGKRHAFLIGTLLVIASSAWAGAVGRRRDYTSFLWSRIIQGVGTSPFESLINAAERGKRMAFTNLAVFGGAFFTPIVVGKITHTIGFWWTFYLVSIFCAACFFALFFFCPETAFRRDAVLNTDTTAFEGSEQQLHPAKHEMNQPTTHQVMSSAGRSKKTYWQSLAPFDGRKTDENFFKLLFRPFPLFVQPAFLWACLIQGAMIGWTVFIGVVLAAIFLGPPLFWDEVSTGYAYVGPFLGAILGFLIAGALSDWSAKYLTKRNGGVYEPEFRILLVIPQLIFGCMGLYGFAITSVGTLTGAYHWTVPIMFFGFEVCGMVIGAVASSLYIVDAYRDLAVEGFTCLIIFKNMFSFGLTFRAYDWLVQGGIREPFIALASVQLVICLLSIPMYVFGKRNRSFFHRHDLLAMTSLR
ncbi:putative Major facilitator superfamily transporter [Seiridium cardinale]|uniref:Major facilitator superfamily transporter n=1 Tax=Seiridium cardinale TaxID=138064 RepID=A0ABR2Y4Q7_9PEZI